MHGLVRRVVPALVLIGVLLLPGTASGSFARSTIGLDSTYGSSLGQPESKLWVARYVSKGDDVATDVAASPDGSTVFVTGESPGPYYDYATVAYDAATGVELWQSGYDHGSIDKAQTLRTSPDGSRVFVTGTSFDSYSFWDFATVAYDAVSGQQLWVARFGGVRGADDQPFDLAVSPDGARVVVAGAACFISQASCTDFTAVAYDASTGEQLWVADYGKEWENDVARAVTISPDGALAFVTGQVATMHGDYLTMAFDMTTGTSVWAAKYNGGEPRGDIAVSVAASKDGKLVLVTGSSASPTSLDYVTLAYAAATGKRRWLARFDGSAARDDTPSSLALSPDGSSVFVTGSSANPVNLDYATVAYAAATGQQKWASVYEGSGSGDDIASSLAPSPDGSAVVVTGSSAGLGSASDYATITYDSSTGAQRHLARYNGPGNAEDVAYSLALSPSGSIAFVTGASTGRKGNLDYATVAYRIT